jgi:hypothetical protein
VRCSPPRSAGGGCASLWIVSRAQAAVKGMRRVGSGHTPTPLCA